jgi:hypothetical protein
MEKEGAMSLLYHSSLFNPKNVVVKLYAEGLRCFKNRQGERKVKIIIYNSLKRIVVDV